MNEAALQILIRARAIARRERERQQLSLISEDAQFKTTIQSKLEGLNDGNQFRNFCRCGEERIFRTCRGCDAVEQYPYRCNLKWCPQCQWRITATRQELIRLWATRIKQPKHMVLTQRNFPVLTRSKLRTHMRNLAALRRRKIFRPVKGGCVSVEITNEERGWHLHSHWLLDVRYLDINRVSQVWGQMVGQEFAICKIMDVRDRDYVQEVSKYVVEGSELASWPGEHINEFVTAVKGTRFFTAFGSLRKLAPDIRAEIEADKPLRKPCDCGCEDFIFEDETQVVLSEVRRMDREGARKGRKPALRPLPLSRDQAMARPTPDLQQSLL